MFDPLRTHKFGHNLSLHREATTFHLIPILLRNNPNHRLEEAHPGDDDYSILHIPSPVEGVPKCKYGRHCYRQNPEHFKNFSHPRITNNQLPRDNDDSNDEDPFGGDSGGSDYVPSDNE